jgi:histidinol-phosphate aminotransferase
MFARHPNHDAAQITAGLRKLGVIVCHFSQSRIELCLRITIGTPEQNGRLFSALGDII